MDTPAISDFPDDRARLKEWRRRRVASEAARDDERRRVKEALEKPPQERTEADRAYLAYSPYGWAAGCGCHHKH